jgi:hypothetical protein
VNVTGRPIITQSSWNLGPAIGGASNASLGGAGNTSDIARYFGMVAPVSAETWISVHHRVWSDDLKKYVFPGNAHQTITTAITDAEYWASKGRCVYLSQGMYRNAGPSMYTDGTPRRHPKADRNYTNLVACKNLYLDVDVKEDGGYGSQQEAFAAVEGFLKWSELPKPSVVVGSGNGGFHLYWTLDTEVESTEFKNMAGRLIAAAVEFGLLFDKECTIDSTRLLRPPGTWNFKYATADESGQWLVPPTPVVLHWCDDGQHIDVTVMQKALAQWKPVAVNPVGKGGAKANGIEPGAVDAHGLPLDEMNEPTGWRDGKKEYAPSDIDEVAKHCPFIHDTLETGGKGYHEPLWKLSMALAARCKEPEATAHRLSRGHDEYNEAATLDKLAQNHGSGPPYCTAVAVSATQCATCQYRDLGKTPLGVAFIANAKLNPVGKAPRAASPVGADEEDAGIPADTSEDSLARRFAATHAAHMRYVALWGKWLIFDGKVWAHDDTMRVFTLVRRVCRDVAVDNPKIKKDLLSASTVAAVERLARSDTRLAAKHDQWDRISGCSTPPVA